MIQQSFRRVPATVTAVLFIIVLTISTSAVAQRTVGLLLRDSARTAAGYTVFSPMAVYDAYMIDINGDLIHKWTSTRLGSGTSHLLPNGNLLRGCLADSNPFYPQPGTCGMVEEIDWNDSVVWSYTYFNDTLSTHHDFEVMPNGHLLLVAWEKHSFAEGIALGRKDSTEIPGSSIWSERVVEVVPGPNHSGTVIWEWRLWDHMIQDKKATGPYYGTVGDHPELIDANFGISTTPDWLHVDAIRYNEQRDEIVLSNQRFSEFYIIDHSTSTALAATHAGGTRGKGGDILYRWGNPRSYRHGAASDQKTFSQHGVRWIEHGLRGAGNILLLNNGGGRPGGNYSSVDEIVLPIAPDGSYMLDPTGKFGPDSASWIYNGKPSNSWFGLNQGNTFRLANGNTLVCAGSLGMFFEVDTMSTFVWRYLNPVSQDGIVAQGKMPKAQTNSMFGLHRYPPEYPGFIGKDMAPKGPIELPWPVHAGAERAESVRRPHLHRVYAGAHRTCATSRERHAWSRRGNAGEWCGITGASFRNV
jgi:hypothetical protein